MKIFLSLVLIYTSVSALVADVLFSSRNGVPTWENEKGFEDDVFTFVRVMYTSNYYRQDAWRVDYPDSDLNFSYRLQQMTTIKVNPDPIVLDIADPRLVNYPFLYLIEPFEMNLPPHEVSALKNYLDKGGFVMIDDVWGSRALDQVHMNFKRLYPDKEFKELPIEHPIFHIVYDFDEKPQVPAINVALAGRSTGVTWEKGEDGRQVHYQGLHDDKGRLMVLFCHNTDLGDGWEREGENKWYFENFSEKLAFPMGVNIVTYAMTH